MKTLESLLIFSGLIFGGLGASSNCPQAPELRLLREEGLPGNVTYDLEAKQVVAGERVNLTLECRAAGPIDMDFEGLLALDLIRVESFRRGEECFSIRIKLTTEREATGLWKCWTLDITKPVTFDQLYMYANGGGSPYLLHGDLGGEEITILAEPGDHLATLPCIVTTPKAAVAIYKANRDGFELLTEGEHLTYDPKFGYGISLQKLPDPWGKYKCVSSSNGAQDEVTFVLNEIQPEKKPSSANKYLPELFESRGKERRPSLVCTGSGSNLYSTSNCRTPIECRLMSKCLKGLTICSSHSCKCINRAQSCSKSFLKNFDKKGSKSCEIIGRNDNGGVLTCSNVSQTYFVGLNGGYVGNWATASVEEIVGISIPSTGADVIYNVGERLGLRCVGSRFVVSSGFRWKLEMANGTITDANSTDHRVTVLDSYIIEEALVHISEVGIKRVICAGPIWNSTDWINAGLELKLRDTVAPQFLEPANITIYFHSGDRNKSIVCEAKGFPHPDILWYKNGEEIRSDLLFDTRIENVTSATLSFPEITESDSGIVYTCNASNPRGMAFKTFTIHVRVSLWTIIFSVMGAVLFICFVVVVIISVQLFRGGKKPSGYTFHFSDFDVEEFKAGNPETAKNLNDISEKAFYLPYDEAKYEIREEDLEIYCDQLLGQGEFGVVLKGQVTEGGESYPVAIKTLKGQDNAQFKALMSELKIMIYIGQHPNVVKLLGAVTSQLAERRAFVIVEYCALGNLEDYLKNRRTNFLDEFDPVALNANQHDVAPPYVRINYMVRTSDLLRWSWSVANAMEYLSSKKIIHGDLATRNVLLNDAQQVKVTDFGLSKQLYKCSSYYLTKSKDIPLPWRWLSPEALRDHSFSVQSDIWAYGILLWEMFSLAETPYGGVSYNADFLHHLANGYRLDKPRYANMEIYSIMRNCWRTEAGCRPSFSSLRSEFGARLPQEVLSQEQNVRGATEESELAAQNASNVRAEQARALIYGTPLNL